MDRAYAYDGWWQDDFALRRFVQHLLTSEARLLCRDALAARPPAPWPDNFALDERGLGVDSLDRLHLVASLGEALDVQFVRRDAAQLAHAEFGAWCAASAAALARNRSATLCFPSSGSTGQPERHRHALAELVEEAEFLATLWPGRRRVLCAVPAHHIYGFIFSVLLPQALGGLVVEEVANPAALVARWQPGDLVIGFPDFWRAFARLGRQAPADICATSSTAPCPGEVAIAIAALGMGLTEIFGSTETAGLGWRADPDAAFCRFPWWRVNADGHWLRRLPDGERIADLPDYLETVGDAHFRPAGRCDAKVQVGGMNVSLAAVRAQLLAHPWVHDAAVRLMRPEEGARLKAFIVPRPGAPAEALLRAELTTWIAAQLPPAQRPRALRFGSQLPRGTMGKAADWDSAIMDEHAG